MKSSTLPRALAVFVGAAAAMIAHAGSSAAGTSGPEIAQQIRNEADYAAAFDRETRGLFTTLLSKGERDASLEAYPTLIEAYRKIVDALFEAYSPHANTLPGWYADRLLQLALGDLEATGPGPAFLRAELASGDFDRVVHAYFLLGRSRIPLHRAEVPTPLWRQMIAVARDDPEDRYWIALALAESKMLPGAEYDRLHTRIAAGSESVRERIGKNAGSLGPRIFRVLGIEPRDVRVSHLRIRYAQDAAHRRVREHVLLSMEPALAYRSVANELREMESGRFSSRRFSAVLEHELPLLLGHFGLPDDPNAMLETVRFLCRGRGSNRMSLWAAADALGRSYDEAMAAAAPEPADDEPLPDAAAILAMGDGALPYLEATLAETSRPVTLRHLFESGAIGRVVSEAPPDDPARLRRALRDAFYALGYPGALRAAYEQALDSLGPEESAHGTASRATLETLRAEFEEVRDARAFDRAFGDYREAHKRGLVPRQGADASFVAAFSGAAVRLLEGEAATAGRVAARLTEARSARRDAALRIEAAEATVIDANTRIREANRALETQEAAQQTAIAAYNEATTRRNAAIERVNAVQRSGRGDLDGARAEAAAVEREQGDSIAAWEREARAAGEAADDAEQRARSELNRARRAEALARSETLRENDAVDAERLAQSELQRSQARFAEILGRLIAGLGFVGVRADPAATVGDEPDPAAQLATIALLLESDAERDPATRRALEQARNSEDARIRTLASLALAQRESGGGR